MPITYTTRMNLEYEVGDTKGDSWNNPWTPEDVYLASEAGGWGVVTRLIDGSVPTYTFLKRAVIYPDTYFDMSGYVLHIYDSAQAVSHEVFTCNGNFKAENAILGIGLLSAFGQRMKITSDDTIIKQFKLICAESFQVQANTGGSFIMEDCQLSAIRNHYHTNTNLNRFTVNGGVYGITPFAAFGEAEDVTVVGSTYAILCGYGSFTITGFKAKDCTYDIRLMPNALGREVYLIDPEVDLDKVSRYKFTTGHRSLKCYLQTTLKINVVGEDLGLKIYEADETLIVDTTFSNAYNDVITYHYFEYEVEDNVVVTNISDSKEPFKIVVSKTNYDDLVIDNIYTESGQPTTIRGDLTTPTYAEPPEVAILDEEPTTIAIIEVETD